MHHLQQWFSYFLVADLLFLIFWWTPNIFTRTVILSRHLLPTLFMWGVQHVLDTTLTQTSGCPHTPRLLPMEMKYLIKAWTALSFHSKGVYSFSLLSGFNSSIYDFAFVVHFCKIKFTQCAIKSDGNNVALNSNNCNFIKHRDAFR